MVVFSHLVVPFYVVDKIGKMPRKKFISDFEIVAYKILFVSAIVKCGVEKVG